jgi:hypothetical protein
MKKFTLYRNMVAFWATALALTLALTAGLSSCDKDEDKDKDNDNNTEEGSDTELYKPSKDMTQKEILALFKEVSDKMATVRKISAEGTTSTTYAGAKPEQYVVKMQEDVDVQKSIELKYSEDGKELVYFTYIDNFIAYQCEWILKTSYKVSDAYWNRSKLAKGISKLFDNFYKLTWKVESDVFVGNDGATNTIEISLTESKKVRTLSNFKEATTSQPSTKEEYAYTYSANPTPPSDFKLSESEFPLAIQYSFRVVWGKDIGSSIFYTYPNSSYVDLDEVIECAPKVLGKKPVLYYDNEFTNLIDNELDEGWLRVENDNSTAAYVKWEDE